MQFADGTQCGAQTKGFDEAKDLAVLAVPLSDISDDTMSKITSQSWAAPTTLSVGEPGDCNRQLLRLRTSRLPPEWSAPLTG